MISLEMLSLETGLVWSTPMNVWVTLSVYASNFVQVPCKALWSQIFLLMLWLKKGRKEILETFDCTEMHCINGAKEKVVHEVGWQWLSLALVHGDGPCTSTIMWGSLLYSYPKFHYFLLLHKFWFHLFRWAMSNWIIYPPMLIKSFLFFFKGNQHRANEQLIKIEGIYCLKE